MGTACARSHHDYFVRAMLVDENFFRRIRCPGADNCTGKQPQVRFSTTSSGDKMRHDSVFPENPLHIG